MINCIHFSDLTKAAEAKSIDVTSIQSAYGLRFVYTISILDSYIFFLMMLLYQTNWESRTFSMMRNQRPCQLDYENSVKKSVKYNLVILIELREGDSVRHLHLTPAIHSLSVPCHAEGLSTRLMEC